MTVKEKIALFPHSPGVYRYYDEAGNVIYVGKAKDLHKRVAQYFVDPSRLNTKTRVLVSRIADAQYAVVASEADALLLENNLIKHYKPRYNILLKDSKTYPWICVTREEYPRVYTTRWLQRGSAQYFGPYSSASYAHSLVDFIHENWPLRTCKHKLTSQSVLQGRFRPCLEWHLGRCKAPCTGAETRESYASYIDEISRVLKGGVGEVIQKYKAMMKEASDALDFEKAQECKNRIDALQKHYSKESVLGTFIGEVEAQFGDLAKEVIVPFLPDVEIDGVEFKVPVRGDKLALLSLSMKNAKEFQSGSLKIREHTNPDEYRAAVLEELRKLLGMKELPVHMECFDNSNIQGTNPVASCVVFRNGEPSKKDYRKFKIKTVVGANDFASMKEVVGRRYSRMLEEAPDDLPQLVVIDGGKGQLDFAYQALSELGLTEKLTVVGLAKRLEEVIRVGDRYPLFIDRNSRALKLLQHIRDEAHRFGITFHRSLRSKNFIQSALREVKGVGEQTEQRLIMHYGSVARIAAASLEDLSAQVGPVLAKRILEHLGS